MADGQSASQHHYVSAVAWTGNRGQSTQRYRGHDSNWNMQASVKAVIACLNDPLLGGDSRRYSPGNLLLPGLSACHILWYLHLAAQSGMIMHAYRDEPLGIGETGADGSGRFLRAELRPQIEQEVGTDRKLAKRLHGQVNRYCLITRSAAFPVSCNANYSWRGGCL